MFNSTFKIGLELHPGSAVYPPRYPTARTRLPRPGISSHRSSLSFDLLSHILLYSLSILAIFSKGQPPVPALFSSLQKLKDSKHKAVKGENRQAPKISHCKKKISKSSSVGSLPGESWQCLVGKFKTLLPKTQCQRNCLLALFVKKPTKTLLKSGRKISPSVEHLHIPKNTAVISIKQLFRWDPSYISHKTSFSQLNIFVGIRAIKSIKFKMWWPWKSTRIGFSKTFEVTLASGFFRGMSLIS